MLPHLPALRRGKSYSSLDQADLKDCGTGVTLARISQVNAGVIRKDLSTIREARDALKQLSCDQLIRICGKAAELFLYETLPLSDQAHAQSPEEYAETLSSTSGLPLVMGEMLNRIGPSLVVTALTKDNDFKQALAEAPLIDRLNLGPVPTTQVSWDQPHEGNLFEFLYRRRSIEVA